MTDKTYGMFLHSTSPGTLRVSGEHMRFDEIGHYLNGLVLCAEASNTTVAEVCGGLPPLEAIANAQLLAGAWNVCVSVDRQAPWRVAEALPNVLSLLSELAGSSVEDPLAARARALLEYIGVRRDNSGRHRYVVGRLHLTTVEGRAGRATIVANGGRIEEFPMQWNRDGDDETAQARLEIDGEVHFVLSGDQWRSLEDAGRTEALMRSVFDGYTAARASHCGVAVRHGG